MRTTVTLEPDVAAAVERLRKVDGLGLSAALNELVRAGLVARREKPRYVHRTFDMGQRMDVNNIGEILTLLDESGQ